MGPARSATGVHVRDEIVDAIEHDELEPLFQPIVDLRTGLVAGYEALSRFMRGRMDVAAWFEEAHRYGMGARLEAHAVACALAVQRRPFGAFLAVNLSPAALISSEVQRDLPDRLDGIVVELTGQGPQPSGDALRGACQDLRDRGGRLAVDLHASLGELMMVGPDVLKLDRSLVDGVHLDAVRAALVGALVSYAREAGTSVCGEGVEALEDLERLADLDVDYAQGFALGPPARPWAGVDPDAARTCTISVTSSLSGKSPPGDLARLPWLAWRLSEATSLPALREAVLGIESELGADGIIVSLIEGDELVVVASGGPSHLEDRLHIADFPQTARLLRDQSPAQIHVTDPEADPAEVRRLRDLGYRSTLMLPISCAGEAIGRLEAGSTAGRPFSRFEIGCARIIALQLGATLERISRS